MRSLVITIVGPERPGVVRLLSDTAQRHGANWSDSVLATFASQFAGVVHLQVPHERSDALQAALQALDSQDLHVQLAWADGPAPAPAVRRMALELVGHDRPGIIHSIASELSALQVSIDRMKTHIASGAMSGEQMFHLQAQLTVPQTLEPGQLQAALESLANELMVDLSTVPLEGA